MPDPGQQRGVAVGPPFEPAYGFRLPAFSILEFLSTWRQWPRYLLRPPLPSGAAFLLAISPLQRSAFATPFPPDGIDRNESPQRVADCPHVPPFAPQLSTARSVP